MSDINQLTLTATVSRAAVVGSTQNGSTLAHLSLEVDRSYALKDGTIKPRRAFFNATIYGQRALRAGHELIAGAKVLILGEVVEDRRKGQTGEWISTFGIEIKEWQRLDAPAVPPPPPGAPSFTVGASQRTPEPQFGGYGQPPPADTAPAAASPRSGSI